MNQTKELKKTIKENRSEFFKVIVEHFEKQGYCKDTAFHMASGRFTTYMEDDGKRSIINALCAE